MRASPRRPHCCRIPPTSCGPSFAPTSERLTLSRGSTEEPWPDVEDQVARSLLEGGRAVVRFPIATGSSVHNVEAEVQGADGRVPCVVVGAPWNDGDVSALGMMLALVRETRVRARSTVHFVAFAPGGMGAFVSRLRSLRQEVRAMVMLDDVSLARVRPQPAVVFVSDLRSSSVARAAVHAFRRASRVQATVLALPGWVPGIHSSVEPVLRKQRWPVVRAVGGSPWRTRHERPPDVDRMAAAIPGLVAALMRLAGGPG